MLMCLDSVRSAFRPALAWGYCVPEVSNTAIENGESETMNDIRPIEVAMPLIEDNQNQEAFRNNSPKRTRHQGIQRQLRWRKSS
jgi:hypothetical protein